MYNSFQYITRVLNISKKIAEYLTILIGIFITSIFIFIEAFILKNYSVSWGKLLDNILKKFNIINIIEKYI